MLLALCIVTSMIPAMTIQSDAAIGSILKVGFTLCKSVVKGTIVTCKNADYYKGNVGKAVLGQFKNIGADLTGLDIGEDYGDGEDEGEQQPTQEELNAIAFEEIKESMKTISNKLDETNNAIYQLESTVSTGVQELSNQLSELYKEINKLGGTVTNAAQLNRYYTYLTEFFTFFNQYYEGISYYDEQLAYAVKGNRTEKYVKNLFDQFYHLENVEYTGNLHSAVTKLGKYIRGEYVSADGGSVIDVLSQYYIQAYKLVHTGCTDAAARKAAASAIEEMVGYIYYAYCTGVYYEEAVLMYQSSYMGRNGIEEYTTDFGTCLSVDQIDDRYLSINEDALLTAGAILGSLLTNYPDGVLTMPYFLQKVSDTNLQCGITRQVSVTGFTMQNPSSDSQGLFTSDPIAFLPDAATALADYFSDDLKEAFSDITTYKVDTSTDLNADRKLKVYDGHILETGTMNGTVNLNVCVLDKPVISIPVNVKEIKRTSTTAAKDAIFGEGTKDFPYIIQNAKDLSVMREKPSAHYVLANNISLNGASWTSFDFSGELDGNGCSIKDMIINGGMGMFNILTGNVHDLYLKNVKVTKSESSVYGSLVRAGVFAGVVSGKGQLYRCVAVDSSVYASSVSTGSTTPDGVVVKGSTGAYVGGIAGNVENGGSIYACLAENIHLTASADNSNAGGIVGKLNDGTVSDCMVDVIGKTVLVDKNSASETLAFEARIVGGIVGSADGKFKIHDAVFCAYKADPFKGGLANGAILGYTDNDALAEKFTGCEVSGKFKLVYRGYNSFTATDIKPYGLSNDTASKYPDVFTASYEMPASLGDISFMEEFYSGLGWTSNDMESYIYPDALEYRTVIYNNSRGNSSLYFKRTYESGECYNASDVVVKYEKLTADKGRYNASLYSILFTGTTYKTPVIEGAKVEYRPFYETNQCMNVFLHVADKHVWVDMIVTAPTCTEEGSYVKMCIDCGQTKDSKAIYPLGHKEVIDPAVSPNCKGDGLTEGSHCEICGIVLVKQEVVVATDDHGHTIVKGYPATCTTDGLTDKDWCEGCGLVHTEAQVIPATGHTMKEYVIVEPACEGGGVTQEKCEICDAYGDFKSTAPLGHTWKKTVVEPTHTEVGYTVYTCESCGESYKGDYLAPIGHTFGESTVTKAATCTSEGELTYSCSCGSSHTVSIAKTAHKLNTVVTDPTCTDIGYTTVSCKHCGYSYVEAYTAPLGHDFDPESATCDHGPVCKICGEIESYDPSHEHEAEAKWDCTDKYHTLAYPCCGYVEVSREAHDWENGTCRICGFACAHTGGTATCSHLAVCSLCGSEYGELDPNNHFDLDHIAARAATTEAEGSVEHWYCVDCGKSYSDGHGKTELSASDIVTEKLPQNIGMILLWVLPFVLNIAAIAVVIVITTKRKKEDIVPSKVG